MLGWKRSVRESFKEHSKQSDKSDNIDSIKACDKSEDKLEMMFTSVKKMLSYLLKMATFEEEFKPIDELGLDNFREKITCLEKKLREEILSMNNM